MSEDDILRRVPPYDLAAEKSVLGAILIRNDAIDRALDILDRDDFYPERHRLIFDAMSALSIARTPIDAVTLLVQLNGSADVIGGPDYIAELASFVPTAANIGHYATIVRNKSIQRSLAFTATEIASAAYEPCADISGMLASAEYEIARVASKQIAAPEPRKATVLAEVLWKLEHGKSDAVPSGFAPLDQTFGGFSVGHITVLAARTSKGKTAFATNIAINAARLGFPTALFTLEMSRNEMWKRAIGCEAQVDLFLAPRRGYRVGERERVQSASQRLEEWPLEMLYRPGMRPRDLRIECRRLSRQAALKLVVIDYFNLMRGDRRERERWREMQEAILALKALAGELGIPILLLSQLNREANDEVPPSLSQLRDTGTAEEHASNVLFLWQRAIKGEVPTTSLDWEDIDVIIGKQRNGPAGLRVPMQFDKTCGKFLAK